MLHIIYAIPKKWAKKTPGILFPGLNPLPILEECNKGGGEVESKVRN